MRTYDSINFADKLRMFSEHWSPRVVAEMNDYQFKLVKFQGEFVWHDHRDTDEVFIVLHGDMVIEFRDGDVTLHEGEMFVVPRSTEHRTFATQECHALVIEPKGIVNTGEADSALTARNNVWI